MSNLKEYSYDIKDLRVVQINKNYIENHDNEYVHYFNDKVQFIVEKLNFEEKDDEGIYYSEYYTECITEEDLLKRISRKPIIDKPEMFSIVKNIPLEYLTEEEIKSGTIKTMRIFKILQDINVDKLESSKTKVKKIKR